MASIVLSVGGPTVTTPHFIFQAAEVAPRDPDLRKKLSECAKAVKRIKFEEALAFEVNSRNTADHSIISVILSHIRVIFLAKIL